MSTPCTVIIGALELLDALRDSTDSGGEVLAFSDAEALKALDTITTRRPAMIALERLFAATSRGAALINRIKADPALFGTEIRVVSLDGTYRISPRRTPVPPTLSTEPAPEPVSVMTDVAIEAVPAADAAAALPEQNLDYRGTRRAQRFRIVEGTEMQLDGALATIVNLSTHGAQILCPTPLRPQQVVRVVFGDDLGNMKCSATVAWASYEIPKGVSRYRAGIEFKDAEPTSVAAFCKRHAL